MQGRLTRARGHRARGAVGVLGRSAMRRGLLIALMVAACAGQPRGSRRAPTVTSMSTRDEVLESTLRSVAGRIDGVVAVTVQRLATGTRASVRGDARLPMMSVFKLPLAIVALS